MARIPGKRIPRSSQSRVSARFACFLTVACLLPAAAGAENTPNTDKKELRRHGVVFSNTRDSNAKGSADAAKPLGAPGRPFAGILVGIARVRPSGLQAVLRDQPAHTISYTQFGLLLGYRIKARATLTATLGHEALKLDQTDPDKDYSFRGRYDVAGWPLFVTYGYEALVFGGEELRGEQSGYQSRFAIRPGVGLGASFFTRVSGYNEYKENIEASGFILPGLVLRTDFVFSKPGFPIGIDLGVGYRAYETATLGASSNSLNLNGPFAEFSALWYF